MTLPEKLEALQIEAAVLRFNWLGFATRAQIGYLISLFKPHAEDREARLALASRLLNRDIDSFNDISAGEAKAMLGNPDLAELLEWVANEP